jgi:hypothetical protein
VRAVDGAQQDVTTDLTGVRTRGSAEAVDGEYEYGCVDIGLERLGVGLVAWRNSRDIAFSV